MSIERILAIVWEFGARHVVLTGGEPMIAPQMVNLTGKLREADLHITIETAGTIYAPVACDLMSISPKLANSTPYEREGGRWAAQHERLRYQPEILKRLISEYPYQLKFVVMSPEDLPEIESICANMGAERERVVLMPEGTASEVLKQRSQWIAEICKQRGYRYSPRLHVDLWGDRRGV